MSLFIFVYHYLALFTSNKVIVKGEIVPAFKTNNR